MKIVIVGAGLVGFNLARQLAAEGHDISVVDRAARRTAEISERMDVLVVTGEATSPSVLRKAEIAEADMVIAITDNNAQNILVCRIAEKFGVPRRVARVRDAEYTRPDAFLTPRDLGIDRMINPDAITAEAIEKLIQAPGATEVADFIDGKILLRNFRVRPESPLCDVPLKELRRAFPGLTFLIVAITRGESVIIPKGDQRLKARDHIYVLFPRDQLQDFLPLVGHHTGEVGKVVIFGATPLGLDVARRLENAVERVIVVEEDRARAEAASELLGDALVLHGSGSDVEFLREYNVNSSDAFIALTADDKANMVSAMLAKQNGVAKTIIVIQEPDYIPLLRSLDIDAVLNPRMLTVGAILSFIRRGQIVSGARLGEGDAEALELVAVEQSRIVGKPLKKVRFPKGAILGAVVGGGGELEIPWGETVIRPGDRVVVFALPDAIDAIENLFVGKGARGGEPQTLPA